MSSSIERQLSQVLHDEVRGLSFRVTAERVEARLSQHRRWRSIRRLAFAGAVAATVLAVATFMVLSGRHEPIVSASPTPSPSPTVATSPETPTIYASPGTITLNLNAPASASVTAPLLCEWSSKNHVASYDGTSADLFGERVSLWLTGANGEPTFQIERQDLAQYDGTGAAFQSQGYGTGTGIIQFQDLTPNPESYPINQPLPSPLDPFVKPIGDNPDARSLSGTLTWDCGAPPAGLPEVDPTPEPQPTDTGTPIVRPKAVVTVGGNAWQAVGIASCGVDVYGPDGAPIGGEGQCGGPDWIVPDAVVEAKPGSTLGLAIEGFQLDPTDVTAAPVSRVEYFRGGAPDVIQTIHATSAAGGALTFAAPPAGDWVVRVQLGGIAPDGSRVHGDFFFHVLTSA